MDADRSGNVLDRLLAQIFETEAELIAHLIMDDARNHDSAGFGERLQPGGHVDAVAKDIVTVDHNVADIDADAELDAVVCLNAGVPLDHAALNINGAAHGVDDADKLHQHPVARGLDDAAAVLGDPGVDQFLAMRLELAQRALLVGAHQSAIVSDIGRENRGLPAIDPRLVHVRRPYVFITAPRALRGR